MAWRLLVSLLQLEFPRLLLERQQQLPRWLFTFGEYFQTYEFPNKEISKHMTWQVQDDPLSRRLAALREWVATCLARFSKHQCLTAHNFGYMWRCECDTVKIESYMWYSHTFGSHTCVFCHWSYKSWYLYMIYTPKATVDLVYIHIWKQSFTQY